MNFMFVIFIYILLGTNYFQRNKSHYLFVTLFVKLVALNAWLPQKIQLNYSAIRHFKRILNTSFGDDRISLTENSAVVPVMYCRSM